jgi:hypothetical protein
MPDIIQINTPGPQGPKGDIGPIGPVGTLTSSTDLTITGSLFISGTAEQGNITGSIITASGGFSGSLEGTASFATSASYSLNATSASHAIIADDATSASHAIIADDATSASHAIIADDATSASYAISSSYTFNATSASYALDATSASFSTTASFALNVPQNTGFPFTGSAAISGSLDVTGPSTFDDLNVEESFTASIISASGAITASAYKGDGSSLTGISGFPFTGSAEISGSLNVDGPLTASAYATTGTGIPTLTSNSSLNLEAANGGVVAITSSSLRLFSYLNSETGSGVFARGDMYFNKDTNKFMGYNGTSHIILG